MEQHITDTEKISELKGIGNYLNGERKRMKVSKQVKNREKRMKRSNIHLMGILDGGEMRRRKRKWERGNIWRADDWEWAEWTGAHELLESESLYLEQGK